MKERGSKCRRSLNSSETAKINQASMTELEFPKPPQAASSGCWSLGSNQYPTGRFPKVSIAIPVKKPKTGTSLNLSQEKPTEEKIKRFSQETTGERPQWISPQAVQRENLNPNLSESLLGERKETVQEVDAAGSSGLKLRLWEILGAGSQNKEATDSPRLRKQETAKKLSQNRNSNGKGKKGTLKLSRNHLENVKLPRENPSSDPIETDSGSMKQPDLRRVTRFLTRSWATPQVTSNQDRGTTEPAKKTEAYIFSFDETELKERGTRKNNSAGGSSTSPKGTRLSKGDKPLHGDISKTDYFKSPTFAMNGTSSSQKRKASEEAMDQPKNPKAPKWSRSMSDSGSDSDLQLSDDSRDSANMSEAKSSEVEVERDAGKSYHPTSEEVPNTENDDANGFFQKGYRRTDKFFSSPDIPIEQSSPVKSKTKAKAVKTEVKRTLELSPPTPHGCSEEESKGSEDILNQFPDNSLASAVCQLVMFLKDLKSKIETKKNKKNSDILSSVTEKIEKQLKDAELQMQEDTRKLIMSSKTKKKELESNFQEQAQKLKVIHEKFRAEVDHYLMDCKSSLDKFEAFQIELKGTADKQKGQHRKLVRHVEREIEAQLTDAETKITRVQKEAEKKMNGLKHALREWVAEGAT